MRIGMGRRVARASEVGCMCRVTEFAGLQVRGSLPNCAGLKQASQLTVRWNTLEPWPLCRSHCAPPSALGEQGQQCHAVLRSLSAPSMLTAYQHQDEEKHLASEFFPGLSGTSWALKYLLSSLRHKINSLDKGGWQNYCPYLTLLLLPHHIYINKCLLSFSQ